MKNKNKELCNQFQTMRNNLPNLTLTPKNFHIKNIYKLSKGSRSNIMKNLKNY